MIIEDCLKIFGAVLVVFFVLAMGVAVFQAGCMRGGYDQPIWCIE